MRAIKPLSKQPVVHASSLSSYRQLWSWLAVIALVAISICWLVWQQSFVETVSVTNTSGAVVKGYDNRVRVPNGAVQTRNGVQIVQVIIASSQPPIEIPIHVGPIKDGYTEILSCVETSKQCLEPGDTLVIASDAGQ